MLTLEIGKKAFDEQDESQLFVRPKNMAINVPHTFQLLTKEIALGYKVLTDSEDEKYIFIPISIPSVKNYNPMEIVKKHASKSVSLDKACFKTLSLSVWSYMHDSSKVLDVSGANIKKILDLLCSVENPLRVKFIITKSETAGKSSYNVSIKVQDNGKPEEVDARLVTKPMHTNNLFFGVSVFDEPKKLETFVKLV